MGCLCPAKPVELAGARDAGQHFNIFVALLRQLAVVSKHPDVRVFQVFFAIAKTKSPETMTGKEMDVIAYTCTNTITKFQ